MEEELLAAAMSRTRLDDFLSVQQHVREETWPFCIPMVLDELGKPVTTGPDPPLLPNEAVELRRFFAKSLFNHPPERRMFRPDWMGTMTSADFKQTVRLCFPQAEKFMQTHLGTALAKDKFLSANITSERLIRLAYDAEGSLFTEDWQTDITIQVCWRLILAPFRDTRMFYAFPEAFDFSADAVAQQAFFRDVPSIGGEEDPQVWFVLCFEQSHWFVVSWQVGGSLEIRNSRSTQEEDDAYLGMIATFINEVVPAEHAVSGPNLYAAVDQQDDEWECWVHAIDAVRSWAFNAKPNAEGRLEIPDPPPNTPSEPFALTRDRISAFLRNLFGQPVEYSLFPWPDRIRRSATTSVRKLYFEWRYEEIAANPDKYPAELRAPWECKRLHEHPAYPKEVRFLQKYFDRPMPTERRRVRRQIAAGTWPIHPSSWKPESEAECPAEKTRPEPPPAQPEPEAEEEIVVPESPQVEILPPLWDHSRSGDLVFEPHVYDKRLFLMSRHDWPFDAPLRGLLLGPPPAPKPAETNKPQTPKVVDADTRTTAGPESPEAEPEQGQEKAPRQRRETRSASRKKSPSKSKTAHKRTRKTALYDESPSTTTDRARKRRRQASRKSPSPPPVTSDLVLREGSAG